MPDANINSQSDDFVRWLKHIYAFINNNNNNNNKSLLNKNSLQPKLNYKFFYINYDYEQDS